MMRPSEYPTTGALLAGIRNGKIARYDGVVSQVFVRGADIGDAQPRDAAENIKYRFVLVGEGAQVVQPAGGIAPSNRKLHKTRIIGSSRMDPVVVLKYNGKFHVSIDEELDPYGCSQEPVEA